MLAEPRAVHRLGSGHRQAEDRLEASGRLARRFAEQISKFENVGIDDMTKNYLQHDTDNFLRFTIFSPRCILTNFLSLFSRLPGFVTSDFADCNDTLVTFGIKKRKKSPSHFFAQSHTFAPKQCQLVTQS